MPQTFSRGEVVGWGPALRKTLMLTEAWAHTKVCAVLYIPQPHEDTRSTDGININVLCWFGLYSLCCRQDETQPHTVLVPEAWWNTASEFRIVPYAIKIFPSWVIDRSMGIAYMYKWKESAISKLCCSIVSEINGKFGNPQAEKHELYFVPYTTAFDEGSGIHPTGFIMALRHESIMASASNNRWQRRFWCNLRGLLHGRID